MEHKPKSRLWILWVAVSVLLVGYPLSMGPAAWLVTHGYLDYESGRMPFEPLFQLYDVSKGASIWISWYTDFWVECPATGSFP